MSKRVIPLLLGLVATLVLGLAGPASAITYEWDTAERGTDSIPTEMQCVWNDYARVCYHSYGDTFWVRDENSDGQSAVADWRDYSGDTGALRRKGGCRNALGSGKWARCNKNFAEIDTIYFRPCRVNWGAGERTPSECGYWIACKANGTGCWAPSSAEVNAIQEGRNPLKVRTR